MTGQPLISAITIFLNGERFIREAIDSVLAQTYQNWELLLVDDGSTDGSSAIALEYARRFPGKIRYLEHDGHQNLGMSASRNAGIRQARGKYIALLDADDVWLPLKFERQAAFMEAHPDVGLLCGRTGTGIAGPGHPKIATATTFPNTDWESKPLSPRRRCFCACTL